MERASNRYASRTPTQPVKDDIPKVNNELSVGSDLEFQRKWWRFERIVWVLFTFLIVLDVLGVFGRGIVAKARARTSDGAVDIEYERIARYSTPSMMTVHFSPSAIRDGKVQFWGERYAAQKAGRATHDAGCGPLHSRWWRRHLQLGLYAAR